MRIHSQTPIITHDTRLKIEKVSSIEHRLSVERQPEIWQALRYQHAQAWIIYREPAMERIDRKDRCLRRKSEHRLHICSGPEIGLELSKERLEDIVLEKLCWIRRGLVRQTLTAAETKTRRRTQTDRQTSRINDSKSLGSLPAGFRRTPRSPTPDADANGKLVKLTPRPRVVSKKKLASMLELLSRTRSIPNSSLLLLFNRGFPASITKSSIATGSRNSDLSIFELDRLGPCSFFGMSRVRGAESCLRIEIEL